MSASVLGGDSLLTQRSLELPSIVPTADGMIGFCTITAQQFQDFLVLIDRPDLSTTTDLASMPGRVRRREEFLRRCSDGRKPEPQRRSSNLRWLCESRSRRSQRRTR